MAACLAGLCGCGSREPAGKNAGGGEFRVLLAAEPGSLDPLQFQDDSLLVVGQNLYSRLVRADADFRLMGDLAREWEIGDGGRSYRFHLERRVKWHDGRPLTAEDVKWTLESFVRGRIRFAWFLSRIAAIETPDQATVVVWLREPWAPFLAYLAWAHTFIVPRHRAPGEGPPVGSGPFRFAAWERGRQIVLERNENYFRYRPMLERLVFQVQANPPESLAALLHRGAVDYAMFRPSAAELSGLLAAPDVVVRTRPHAARYYLGFNLRRAPFHDVAVRRAVAQALDKSALVEQAMAGASTPAVGFYTPAISWAYDAAARAPEYDPAAARKALSRVQAGRRLLLRAADMPPFAELARAAAAQLERAGLPVVVRTTGMRTWNQDVLDEHDFDLAVADGNWGPDPDVLDFRFGSHGSYQFMGYASAEFDALMEEGARGPSIAARARAYFRAQQILARDLPAVPLCENVQYHIFRSGFAGLPQVEAQAVAGVNDFSLVRWTR